MPDIDTAAIAELLAKQSLYENIALYCRGQDRKDLELMKSTFWPEAQDNHGSYVGPAYEFCDWAFENQKNTKHRSHHYLTNVLVEIDGDFAKRESSFIYVMVQPDGLTNAQGGRYRDFCERRHGKWKVLNRVVIHDHAAQYSSASVNGALFGRMQETARMGDIYPNDPIYDVEW